MQKNSRETDKAGTDRETLIQSLLYIITDRIGFIRQIRTLLLREITERSRRFMIGLVLLAAALGFLFSAAVAVNVFIYYILYNYTQSILISIAGILVLNTAAGFIFLINALRWFAYAVKSLARPPDSRNLPNRK